jgi:hypothetical protein
LSRIGNFGHIVVSIFFIFCTQKVETLIAFSCFLPSYLIKHSLVRFERLAIIAANGKAFVFVAELAFRLLEQMPIKNTKVDDKIYCPIYNVQLEQKVQFCN